MNPQSLDLPWWIDISMIVFWYALLLLQGQRIVTLGHSADRWLQLVAWGLLASWWTFRFWTAGDVLVSAPSAVAVLLLGVSSVISARRQLKIWRADVRCFRNHEHRCYRADRIRDVLTRDP